VFGILVLVLRLGMLKPSGEVVVGEVKIFFLSFCWMELYTVVLLD
jgi:hypothetical protein